VLDAQYFGVAQRRRRVFVVGCLGDWKPTAEVLFESESLSRNTKSSRKTRQSVAGYVESSFGQYREDVIAGTTKASGGVLSGGSETFIVGALDTECGGQKLSHQSINSGHIFAVYENHPSDSRVKEMGNICQTVTSTWGAGGGNIPFVQNIAYEWHNQDSRIKPIDVAATLNCNASGREGHLVQSFGWQNSASQSMSVDSITPTLDKSKTPALFNNMAVRRLTPVECERLQGFPDNYTNIKEKCPDGARYKALGNSMAVPVMRWIGERINSYETMRSKAVVQVEAGMGTTEV